MREILFRGQTRRFGEKVRMGDGQKSPSIWVYGGVLQGVGDHSIIYGGKNENNPSEGLDKWVVYTDTLGQYTGLTDKNGKKIFEGDILEYRSDMISLRFGDRTGAAEVSRRVVEWGEYGWVYKEFYNNRWDSIWNNYGRKDHLYKENACKFATVIGNIHDYPELLGSQSMLNGDVNR